MTQRFHEKLIGFAAASALSACAATGPAPANGPGPASAVTPPATTTAANNAPKAYGNYIRVVHGGQSLYCQKEADTSTRMVHETCLTQAQAQAQEENARNFMQGATGIANTPVSGPNVR